MGASRFADIPSNVNTITYALASIASNAAAATYPVCVVPANSQVVGAYLQFSESRASGTKSDSLTLVNLGTAGTGTTALGTHLATAAFASYSGLSLSLTSSPTVPSGGAIGFVWASAAAGTTVPAGIATIHLRFI